MNSRYRRERRQPPYYLITGLVIGLILGIVVSFLILPARYTNVPPETLSTEGKDQYRLMIASAYRNNPNINRAQSRLGLLREEDLVLSLENQVARSDSKTDAQLLQNLIKAVNVPLTAQTTPTDLPQPSATPTKTFVPTLADTPTPGVSTPNDGAVRTATPVSETTRSASTPLPTAGSNNVKAIPFVLREKKTVCNPSLTESLIQIEVFDADGDPLSNAKVIVSWAEGSSTFYTGYYPEISAGYADFTMTPPTAYLVKVGDIGEIVQNLTAPECEENDLPYWGSIYLSFDEP